jgi:hypothetical protein
MKRTLSVALLCSLCFALLAAAPEEKSSKPQYDTKGGLLRPDDYREWMFLSAGYGMNYSPTPGSHEMFTNVFVPRWAYQEFAASGKWPEQTMAVEVKDSSRYPEKWAYFGFDAEGKTSEAMPKGNGCWSCHEEHAAVEHTFVQFYPTLKPIAKKFRVYNEKREQVPDTK